MSKKYLKYSWIIVVIGLFVWILWPTEEEAIEPILPNVRVMEVTTSSNQEDMKFVGFIQPEDVYEATFGTVGTIENIYVTLGQSVRVGTVLASINDQNARLNIDNANQQYDSALSNQKQARALMQAEAANLENERQLQSQRIEQAKQTLDASQQAYEQAQEAYNDAVENHGETSSEAIEAQAIVAQREIERDAAQAVLNNLTSEEPATLAIALSRYEASVAAYESTTTQAAIALNNVQIAQNQLEDTKLKSGVDGKVVAIIQSVGELATPLVPTIVIASNELVAVFGLSQSNVNLVKTNMPATVTSGAQELEGSISNISFIPDETSRTYEARVDIGVVADVNIGETVQIMINLGETDGVWLDLSLLLNDGEDYVYVVVDNRIVKRVVQRGSIQNQLVLVYNLNEGDLVVIEGGQSLKVGTKVNVIRETNHD
jgi:multidrug efflux pump subunit AcrA (membrane-fusion protein)